MRRLTTYAAVAALGLGAAACGGDDDKGARTTGAAAPEEAEAGPTPVADLKRLTGDRTEVKLDTVFVEGLSALQLTAGAVGDAKLSGGVASFPITGGSATYFTPGAVSPYVRGLIEHDGSGLSLEAGGKRVELTNFDVDPGASLLTGKVSVDGGKAKKAPLFFLDGSTLEPLKTRGGGKTAILQGTTVRLKQESAELLNETFGIDALEGGFPVGEAKIVLDVPAS